MDLLFEFLGELFFEGIIEIIKNKKISLVIRIPIYIIFSAFTLGIAFVLAYIGLKNISNLISIVLLISAIVIVCFYIIFTYKIFKK